MTKSQSNSDSRRSFLKKSAGAAMATGAALSVAQSAHAAGTRETVRVGLIGCGGRGTGAVNNALNANPQNQVVGLCDMFQERLDSCRRRLETSRKDQTNITDDNCFVGIRWLQEASGDGILMLSCSLLHPTFAQPS